MEHEFLLQIIRNKRDGKELSIKEIQKFVASLGSADLSETQIGAFLMAVYINKLSPAETASLTKSMAYSGVTLDWPIEWKGTVVDKHATGGVGDKTSIVLAPALAACGLRVPMISGRALGHTGGTLDKLESIPGLKINLSAAEIHDAIKDFGCCIVGQTEDIVPADKILYRLRNHTGTVENEGLVVASIISKKAAEGLDALVLDVKFGSGTLIHELAAAESLAKAMVETGKTFGMKMSTVLSRMDSPLGYAVGNAVEIAEAIDTLQNNGPQDLLELVTALGGKLLKSTGCVTSVREGKDCIRSVIADGSALQKFNAMLISQGCSPAVAQELCTGDKWQILPRAPRTTPILAKSTGFVLSLDALTIGGASHGLGCLGKDIITKHRSGIVLIKKPGDAVAKGDVILDIHHDDCDISSFLTSIENSIQIVLQKPTVSPLLHKHGKRNGVA